MLLYLTHCISRNKTQYYLELMYKQSWTRCSTKRTIMYSRKTLMMSIRESMSCLPALFNLHTTGAVFCRTQINALSNRETCRRHQLNLNWINSLANQSTTRLVFALERVAYLIIQYEHLMLLPDSFPNTKLKVGSFQLNGFHRGAINFIN